MNKFKQHFVDHKELYIGIGVGVLVGAATAVIFVAKKGEVSTDINQTGVVIWKSPITTEVHLERLGHPGNVVRCIQTGELFASQNRAAKLLNISPTSLSQHLKGQRDSVSDLTFEIIGVAE